MLSIFDGIGTGLLVMNKLNLDVEVYYSSEIFEDALLVQRNKFPGQTVMLGDVCGLKDATLDALGRIDLLIGGKR